VLYLVRHGEVANPTGVRYGRLPGFALSAKGLAQSEQTARHLATLGTRPERLLSSPLERAQQTAAILGKALGLESRVEPGLIEASSWLDGLPRTRPGPVRLWRQWRSPERPLNEPPLMVLDRVRAVLEQHLADVSALLAVTHETPIWLLRLGYEKHLGRSGGPRLLRRAPWLGRVRSSPASLTTLVFPSNGEEVLIRYWEPAEA
jgi:broad specificity phosphatase PhoE